MKFYLSSYELGNNPIKYADLIPKNGLIGYISNGLDFSKANREKVDNRIQNDIKNLREMGLNVELLNLKEYFDKQITLQQKIAQLSGLWVCGGNVFVLRQAMKLSGLDDLLNSYTTNDDFVYGGYSAGCCVLSSTLKPYQVASDATDFPYENQKTVIWEGLGLIDFAFMPHYKSEHSESSDIDKEIDYCKHNNIPYKALPDGEVLIFE